MEPTATGKTDSSGSVHGATVVVSGGSVGVIGIVAIAAVVLDDGTSVVEVVVISVEVAVGESLPFPQDVAIKASVTKPARPIRPISFDVRTRGSARKIHVLDFPYILGGKARDASLLTCSVAHPSKHIVSLDLINYQSTAILLSHTWKALLLLQ